MSRPEVAAAVQASVLDRLIDRDPLLSADPAPNWAQSVLRFKESVRRDLEWLLNTRRIVDPAPQSFAELQTSLYHYGLPDITSLSADAPDTQLRLLEQIQETIELFEPRLAGVRVTASEPDDRRRREIRFLIEGLLRIEPAPEQVAFDTVLEVSSGEFHIR